MLIGYRCKVCGAPVDPETGYCQYCDTLNFKPIIDKPIKDDGRTDFGFEWPVNNTR